MTGVIDIAAIHVGDRRRRDMGDLASLARSIADVGLLHAVVVTPERLDQRRCILGHHASSLLSRRRMQSRVEREPLLKLQQDRARAAAPSLGLTSWVRFIRHPPQ